MKADKYWGIDPAATTFYLLLQERLLSEVHAAEQRLELLSQSMVEFWSPGTMAHRPDLDIATQIAYHNPMMGALDQFMQKLTALPSQPSTEYVLKELKSIVHTCLVETVLSLSSIVAWLEWYFKPTTEELRLNIMGDS